MNINDFVHDILSKAQDIGLYKEELSRAFNGIVFFCLLFMPVELLFPLKRKKIMRKEAVTDMIWLFLNYFVPKFPIYLISLGLALFFYRVMPVRLHSFGESLPFWAAFPLSLVITEIGGYWGHRLSHEIPFLWRFHAIHHSAEEMDFLVNSRAHPVDLIFTRFVGLIPVIALGLANPLRGKPDWVLLALSFAQTSWAFFIHSNVKWRMDGLSKILVTPLFHHWHHTNDGPQYVNKNYASLFSFVDTLFGTYYCPRNRRPQKFGINEPMPSNVLGQLVHPFRPRRKKPRETFQPGHSPFQVPDDGQKGQTDCDPPTPPPRKPGSEPTSDELDGKS